MERESERDLGSGGPIRKDGRVLLPPSCTYHAPDSFLSFWGVGVEMMMCREPRPGELQKFVDGLISRSLGVQDEVEKIARVQKHHRYIQKKESRDAIGHRKLKLRKPTEAETATRIESRRKRAIDRYGACKICGERAICHGDSPSSQRAGLEEKCRVCYDRSHGIKTRHERGGEEYTSKLIRKNGLCHKCECHAISGGVSEISVLARDAGLCLYCYRSTRTRSRGPRQKICRKCGLACVAPGPSLLSVVARRKGLCLKCHRYVDRETEE